MSNFIRVILWGEEIGSLMWRKERKNTYFVYNPTYLNNNIEPFPIAAPKTNKLMKMFVGEEQRMYQHLPSFIADSLPDNWGNIIFHRWVADQNLSDADITPLDKLVFIGKRGMGALEFQPDMSPLQQHKEKINIADLASLAQKIFIERENAHILPNEELTKQSLIAVGTSAGGRQPKAIIAINRQTGEIRSGQLAGLDGYDYYIIKFGDTERSSAELEMAYYQMAVEAGIDIMPSRLLEADGEKHFITQRFDRPNGNKLHIQTLAAMDPEAGSYESLLLVCRKLHLPDAATDEVFRRMAFNHLANNTDDHHKNFSFLMNKQGEWSLSPAYDLTYIFNRGGYQPETDHCLLLRGKYNRWTKDDMLAFASKYGINEPDKILRQVANAVMQFRSFAEMNGAKQEWIGRIENTLQERLREWGFVSELHNQEWTTIGGEHITHPFIEQAYKGNYHLFATSNGRQRKFIIRKGTADFEMIENTGMHNISLEQLKSLIDRLLQPLSRDI